MIRKKNLNIDFDYNKTFFYFQLRIRYDNYLLLAWIITIISLSIIP